ncbi:MAG: alanine racemase [Clostridiales bacterium]|nr:alanine racemase [Clostridiales bacterium]
MQTIVDLSRMRHNVRMFRARTRNGFCAVVKSNAYGHGIMAACGIETLADCFMVATADEALELLSVINKPVLVLGGDISPYMRFYESQIVPTVYNCSQLNWVLNAGYKRFSVEIDTGMHRLGADENELNAIVARCKELDVKPWSVYSHLYGGISSAAEQAAEFGRLTAEPILKGKRHLYCSCALDLDGFDLFDMSRCGIAMYGYHSGMNICMKVRAKIVALNLVHRGEHVGYGDYTLDRDALIATVRCGYADGLRRCDKQLYLKVRGVKCKVVGVPCMDLCMIDVTGLQCRVGEYAYLISEKEDAEYLAKCYGTIVYEVLTGFNGRAERIYI